MSNKLTCKTWGYHNDKEVFLFTFRNADGTSVQLTNYGAGIVSIVVPDRWGKLGDAVLGFDHFEGYLQDNCYIGSTIGRFANRMNNATFRLDDNDFFLEANDGLHANHSGNTGFHKKLFDFEIDGDRLLLSYQSPDKEGGFPGTLDVTVAYEWSADHELKISYQAVSDKNTIVSLTNHAYFNLSAESETIFNHQLQLNSNTLLEATSEYIPTGKIIAAQNTLSRLNTVVRQLTLTGKAGFNDYFIINGVSGNEPHKLNLAAVLHHEMSGRRLTVYTTYPGLMVYTGDYLHISSPASAKRNFQPYHGICLECQLYPDAPNHCSFPSALLKAGECYEHQIIYAFTTASTL